jgi:hypothetical protein
MHGNFAKGVYQERGFCCLRTKRLLHVHICQTKKGYAMRNAHGAGASSSDALSSSSSSDEEQLSKVETSGGACCAARVACHGRQSRCCSSRRSFMVSLRIGLGPRLSQGVRRGCLPVEANAPLVGILAEGLPDHVRLLERDGAQRPPHGRWPPALQRRLEGVPLVVLGQEGGREGGRVARRLRFLRRLVVVIRGPVGLLAIVQPVVAAVPGCRLQVLDGLQEALFQVGAGKRRGRCGGRRRQVGRRAWLAGQG